jgi:hypothetical protein
MTTPATAAATAPSCAVKPVALLFPKVIPLPLPLDVVVGPLVAAVVVPPRPPRALVAVAAPAVELAPLPKPVPERPDPVVEAEPLPPALTPETGYPASVQSVSRAIERSSSDKVYPATKIQRTLDVVRANTWDGNTL